MSLNNIEYNAILYYADFLSIKQSYVPITDTCKYFFIHKVPINAAYIAGNEPIFDINSPYYIQAKCEYLVLRDKFGEDGVLSYINNIANLGVAGCVDAIRMLKCVLYYEDRETRREAYKTYYTWRDNQTYTHIIKDDNGDDHEQKCSKYIDHYERMLKKQEVLKSLKLADKRTKSKVEEPVL